MMHNRIYCLWLNKEEESDSQLEITNRLCLVSGCEGCCLVVEYDDHWLSELWVCRDQKTSMKSLEKLSQARIPRRRSDGSPLPQPSRSFLFPLK
ncbi:hypothetical protein F2Q69_00023950 [Brassica cretica]|nr:hypothetical protein F2Q69_00023950 [Brassica cretica]